MAQSGGVGAFKDVLLALVIVGGVLGGLFLYTGVWPPMVVVESGSMMHLKTDVGYGKVGTIDPGDMVFVKRVDKLDDITPLARGAAQHAGNNYGKPGDVLVYFPFNQRTRTPIIHRAIAYVDVANADPQCTLSGNPGSSVQYSVFWDGSDHSFSSSGIYLPTMGFAEPNYTPDRGYKPCWSGYITKGDNPISNQYPDQAFGGGTLPNQPVQLSWVEGKAVGELPWFGLIKLGLSGTSNYECSRNGAPQYRPGDPACDNGQALRILNAVAPADLWVSLGISLAIIAIAPLAYDLYSLKRQKDQEKNPPGGGGSGGPPPSSPFDSAREKLGLGKPESPPDEGADPDAAFRPPPPATGSSSGAGASSSTSPGTSSPSSAPPAAEAGSAPPKTKFERVTKK